jgi:hypothetical protein
MREGGIRDIDELIDAQMELQPAGGFHPYILRLLNYRLSQSTVTLTREISLPRRLRDTWKVTDRPRVEIPRQDRAIHLAHLRNRHVCHMIPLKVE